MAASGKAGQVALWVLMAMLAFGLGGFGITNFGGSVRSIGKVDGQEISTTAYFRALQAALNDFQARTGQPLNMTDAAAIGLDAAVRRQLVGAAALDAAVARLGVSVGDTRLAAEIQTIPAFRGAGGAFDAAAYRRTLQDNGLKEAEFEAQLRRDMSRGLVEAAISSGFAGSPVVATALLAHLGEKRSVSLLRLTADDLPEATAAPDDAALRAYYDAHPAAFTRPEARRISHASLRVADLAATITIDEAELRALYDQRAAQYNRPEQRLVERLVYPDAATATAARNRLDAGQADFADLVAERGLELADIDLGAVTRRDLGPAGDGVFDLTEPGVVGPLDSSLGPALFRMNGVIPAQETPFDAVRDALRQELAADQARRRMGERVEAIEDLLAGGATLEDLVREAGMVLETGDYTADDRDGLAGDARFREQAARIGAGDFPELTRLTDGGLAVLRLEEIIPPTLHPFDEVVAAVTAAVQADAETAALRARLAAVTAAVAGGATLESQGVVSVHSALGRGEGITDAPADLGTVIFAAPPGEVRSIDEPGFVGLVRVDEVIAADQDSPDAQAMKAAFVAQQGAEFGADAYALFTAALEQGAQITLDEAAINSIHSQMR